MVRRLTAFAVVLIAAACSKQDGPPNTIVSPADPSNISKPPPPGTTSTGTTATGFPPLEDACTIDADCAIVGRDKGCCSVCGGMYGNKKWVADVEAYCSRPGAAAGCPPPTPCER